ncbi:uncharacterized protein LOC125229086 [Leguminivora glycinivorella]|uniref:uncharacterized protein LOC125229086 n=1 Tax=Leguminivora glycinivorella TaxID=1035111 RepID=UPI0020105949|nr:uncharacterized protein LOC125229086 [Leguminivora glycinivorella]
MVQIPLMIDDSPLQPRVPGKRGAKNPRAEISPKNNITTQARKTDSEMLNVLTYNVRTLKNEERLIELEHALKEVKWDVVGLSEVRRDGEQIIEREDNVFYHFGTAGGLYGVYAPTSSHSDDEIEEYYDLLNKACDENRGTWTMVLGDFNAKVGIRTELDNADIVGPHDNILPITGSEINAALKSMKYQKSPGDDGVTTETILSFSPTRHLNYNACMLQDLSTASLEVGLTMNRAKTKLMTNGAKDGVTVDGQDIQYVDEYIYLGQIASFENRQTLEVNRRIENAWKSFWSMKALLKGDLPLCLKRKLIDMCILPILTYGAQTWSLTEALKSKLKVCQRAMERSILGVRRTDRIRNTELRSRTRVVDVGAKTAKLKWDWAGHVCRMHPERAPPEVSNNSFLE